MIYSAAYSESQLEGRWSLAGSTLHKDPVAGDHSQAAGFFRARVESGLVARTAGDAQPSATCGR